MGCLGCAEAAELMTDITHNIEEGAAEAAPANDNRVDASTDEMVLAAIQQAAQLTDIEYETQRTDIAKALNVRVRWLDEQVKKARPKAEKPKPKVEDREYPYQRDDMGNIIANSQYNILAAVLNLKVTLRYDLLKEKALMNGKPITDSLVDDLWLRIDEHEKFRPNREFFDIVLGMIARNNSFHPVLDYLNSLEWDGVPRLDKLFHTYFNAEDTEFNSKIGICLLLTAVRRLKQPGTKWDELPILENQQGKGKSTGLKNLVGNLDWFTDTLDLTASPKVLMEQTAGYWIVEVQEINGMNRADYRRLKAMLSRTKDTARMAYARHAEERPRQFVAIGTTNDMDYLGDPTGNRRFWPVRLSDEAIDQEAIIRDRDQLWAEAVVREAQGESNRLPPELWEVAAQVQRERMRDDPWFTKLFDAIGDMEGRIKEETLWDIIGGIEPAKRTSRDASRITSAMRQLGWSKKRIVVNGERVQGWTKGEQQVGVPLPRLEWIPSNGKLKVVTLATPPGDPSED
jgi:predicted P-loop ATPase